MATRSRATRSGSDAQRREETCWCVSEQTWLYPPFWGFDGVTGYIAETVEGMASAVRRIDRIDRSRCRQHVEDNFSVRTMTDRYERLYEGLVRR